MPKPVKLNETNEKITRKEKAMRLLLVEDDQALQQELQQQLLLQNYSVDVASDGEIALFQGLEYDYDIAVIDLGLPKIDGTTVVKALREKGRNFPILILTARDRWQDKVEGLDAGADDYLTKPFNPRELTIRARNILNRILPSNVEKDDAIIYFNQWSLNGNSRKMITPDTVSYTHLTLPTICSV